MTRIFSVFQGTEIKQILSSPGEKSEPIKMEITSDSLDVSLGSPTLADDPQHDLFRFTRTQSATIPRSPSVRRKDAKSYRRSLSSEKKRTAPRSEASDSSPDSFQRRSPIRRRRPQTLYLPESPKSDEFVSKRKSLKRSQTERRVVKRQVVDEYGRKRMREIVEPSSPVAQDAGTVIIHAPNQTGTTSSEEVFSFEIE